MAQANLKRMTPEEHEAQVKYWEDVFAETQPRQERIRAANRAFDTFCAKSTEENYRLWRKALHRINQPEGFLHRVARWIGRYVGW